MSDVRISSARAHAVSTEAAVKLVTQVIYEVEFEAKILSSIGPYSAGILSDSIHKHGPFVEGDNVRGTVGSPLKYAMSVHSGAKIHPIFPKGAAHFYRFGRGHGRPMLKFFWRKAGKVVWLPQIPGSPTKVGFSHPGIKHGKHYLSEPLRNAARRHGMRYITRDF